MAGLDINDLVCLDDTTDSDSSTGTNTATGLSSLPALQEKGLLSITLTDHNALAHKWGEGGAAAALDQAVVAIVDHHEDKGEHAHVRGSARNVAFDASTGREEAGSCCTLVAENFLLARHSNSSSSSSMGIADGEGDGELTSSLPEDIALLLSGVILLDTCNMDAAVGKGRPRDAAALDALFAAMPPEKRGMRDSIFRELNGAKTDPTFWAALSARDALRLDYKHFRVGRGRALGMSSVLLSLSHLKNKDDLESALAAHFTPSVARKGVDLLVCMCMVVPEEGIAGERRRELMVVGSRIQLDALREFLDKDEAGKAMGAAIVGHRMILAPAPGAATESSVDAADAADEVLMADCYAQANVRMSRKQAAPLLERFLAGL
jgi:inorganic pyrophosphatase/exopolyphosphatase